MDALGIEEAHWVGNAWGGHVGYCAAATHPQRIRSLTAIASPLTPLPPKERRANGLLVTLYPLIGPKPVLGKVLGALLHPSTRGPDSYPEQVIRRTLLAAPRRALQHAMRSAMLDRPDLTSVADRVACPLLVLCGEDDPMWSIADARTSHRQPGVRSATIARARHLPPLEAPEAVAQKILGFWSSASGT